MDTVLKIVLLLLIPSVFGFMTGINLFPDKKKAAIFSFIAAVFSGLLSGVLKLLILKHWTIYEMLLSATLLSLVGLCIWQIIRDKKKFTCDFALRVLCFASIAVTFFYIATYGQANLNSDNGMITRLAKSRAENLTLFPQTWYYANGDIGQWISTITCTAPFTLIMENQSLARVLGTIIYLIANFASVYFLCKKLFLNDSWKIIIPLSCIFITGQSSITHIEGAYIGTLLSTGLFATWSYYAVFSGKKLYICFLGVYLFIRAAGGIRIIADWSIPLVFTILLFLYFHSKNKERTLLLNNTRNSILICFVIIVSSLLGVMVYRWLVSWNNVNNTINNATVFVGSISSCINNLWGYFANLFECFGFTGQVNLFSFDGIRNIISIIMCLLICFIVPILQIIKLKEETDSVKFLVWCIIIQISIKIIMNTCISFGENAPRYVLSSVYLSIIISSRYIYEYWLKKIKIDKRVLTFLFSVATVIECVFLVSFTPGWSQALEEKKEINEILSEKGLKKGFATYWCAYSNELYSDNKIKFGGIKLTQRWARKDLWLVDASVYDETEDNSFLLMTDVEEEQFGERAIEIFGEPEEKIVYPPYKAYIYDYDIARNIKDPNVYKASEFFPNGTAEYQEDQITIYPGGSSYGPFERINMGKYEVVISGSNLDKCDYDIFSYTNQAVIDYKEKSRTSQEIVITLTVNGYLNDIEFRLFNNSDKIVILKEITTDFL